MYARYAQLLADDYGLPGATLRPITLGTTNKNYVVSVGRKRYILRRCNSTAQYPLVNMSSFLKAARSAKLPVARLIPTTGGRPFVRRGRLVYLLLDYMPGMPITKQQDVAATQLKQVAVALANIHLLPWHAPVPNPTLVPQYMLRVYAHHAPRLSNTLFDGKRDFLHTMQDELRITKAKFTSWERLPTTTIHNDPYLNNFLFSDGVLTAMLDLDDVGEGIPLLDIGRVINTWCFSDDGQLDEQLADTFMTAYQRIRPLSDIERYHLCDLIRFVAFRHCVWFIKMCAQGQAPQPALAIDYLALRHWRAHPQSASAFLH